MQTFAARIAVIYAILTARLYDIEKAEENKLDSMIASYFHYSGEPNENGEKRIKRLQTAISRMSMQTGHLGYEMGENEI